MKKVSLFIVLWLIPFMVYANPYSKTQIWNGKEMSNCTYTAWQETYDRLKIQLPAWGNANTWLKSAKNAGFKVGKEPKANSIVVFDDNYEGHVAYVVSVNLEEEVYTLAGEGTMSIYEYEVNGFSTLGYIYVNEPRESTESSSSKSNDSFLKSLIIDNYEINFQRDVFTYYIDVPYDVEKIVVSGETSDSKAKVEGLKEYNLNYGENNISIKVMAEDESVSIYNLIITRKEDEDKEENQNNAEKNELNNNINNNSEVSSKRNQNKRRIVGGLLILVLVLVMGLIIVLIKRNNRKVNS